MAPKKSDTETNQPKTSTNAKLPPPTTASTTKKRGKFKGTSEADLNNFADRIFGGKRTQSNENHTKSSQNSGFPKNKPKKPTNKKQINVSDHSIFKILLNSFLAIDASISRFIAICATPGSIFRPFAILLEYSGHGVPWFLVIGYMILYTSLADRHRLFVLYNYLFSLILDVMLVGVIKSLVKRKRPSYNHGADMHTLDGLGEFV